MQKKILWSLLFGSTISFMTTWILFCVLIWIYVVDYNGLNSYSSIILGIGIGVGAIIFTLLTTYFEINSKRVIDYENPKQIRLKNKIRKLNAKKEFLMNRNREEQEIHILKHQIKIINLGFKNKIRLCVHCNTRIPQKACFCPNCGCEV